MQETIIKYLPQALDIIVPILLLLLSWAAAEVAKYIRSKTAEGNVQAALLRLEDGAFAVVSQMAQGTAGLLKEASKDGKLEPEEVAAIRREAMDKFADYLGKEMGQMRALFGDAALQAMMRAKIEQALIELKSEYLKK